MIDGPADTAEPLDKTLCQNAKEGDTRTETNTGFPDNFFENASALFLKGNFLY